MFSNNPKVASFYPTAKKTNHFNNYQNANFINQNVGNQNFANQTVNNELNFINNNYNSVSDSVELALITVNLNYPRFKSMNVHEVETYIKNMAINNAYDNKKYLLALNILLNEAKKMQQNLIIKQNIPQNEKSKINNNSIDFNNVAVIEPDEFNLDINSQMTTQITPQPNFFIKQDFTNQSNVSQPKFAIKQNRNLDLSTFHGNPFGVTKITNNNPVSSVRPINRMNDNLSNFNTSINNNDNTSNYQTATNFASDDFSDNFSNNFSQRSLSTSNIIKQGSFIQNTSTVFASGGKRRTSNLDVGSSNNYLSFQ